MLSNDAVVCDVTLSNFISCASNSSGGAIATIDGAHLSVSNATFLGNTANGLGGGALYSKQVAKSSKFRFH